MRTVGVRQLNTVCLEAVPNFWMQFIGPRLARKSRELGRIHAAFRGSAKLQQDHKERVEGLEASRNIVECCP